MKCVVTTTATPLVVSALMWCQNSRRMRGSTPLVGSSRNSTAGACSVAQASARRCLKPSGRSEAFECRSGASSNISTIERTRSRLTARFKP